MVGFLQVVIIAKMKNNSKCKSPGKILCDFKVLYDKPDAQVEVCRNCGKKVIYNRRDGRIDNDQYRRDHKRDILQSRGKDKRLFKKIYGK